MREVLDWSCRVLYLYLHLYLCLCLYFILYLYMCSVFISQCRANVSRWEKFEVGNDRPSPARTDCLSPVRKFHTGQRRKISSSVQELLALLLLLGNHWIQHGENFGQHNSRRVVRQLLYGLVHIEVEFHTHCLVLQQMFNYAHRQ